MEDLGRSDLERDVMAVLLAVLAAWAVLVGLVNTTMHHEHALISVMLLGGWLALARSPGQTQAGDA